MVYHAERVRRQLKWWYNQSITQLEDFYKIKKSMGTKNVKRKNVLKVQKKGRLQRVIISKVFTLNITQQGIPDIILVGQRDDWNTVSCLTVVTEYPWTDICRL